jgi:FlaA1/EpsC-like NDP-sugar epimerase
MISLLVNLCLFLRNAVLTLVFPNYFNQDVKENIILITGAGKGVGRLLATEFAKLKPKHVSSIEFMAISIIELLKRNTYLL